MLKLKPAQPKRRNLSTSSIRRAHSTHSPRRPSGISAIIKKSVIFLFVVFSVIGVCYAVYNSILNTALQRSEPQTLLLVPSSIENTDNIVVLVKLGREAQDSYLVRIAGSQEVALPAGYGSYRLSAMYPLLLMDKRDQQFITGSFSRTLHTILNTTYALDSLNVEDDSFSQSILVLAFNEFLKTKKIPFDLIKLWHFSKASLDTRSVSSVDELQQLLDAKKKEQYIMSDCQVAVLNASEHDGAASTLTEVFEKSGLVTIRTSSFSQLAAKTTIYHSGKLYCTKVLEMIPNVFVNKPQIIEDEKITAQYRAPIVIVIGADFE